MPVQKKQTKPYCEFITKRGVICIRSTMLQEKKLKEKYLERKMYVCKFSRSWPCQPRYFKKDVRTITGQHFNVNHRNNINPSLAFSKKRILNESVPERSVSSSPRIKSRGKWNSCRKIQSTYNCA